MGIEASAGARTGRRVNQTEHLQTEHLQTEHLQTEHLQTKHLQTRYLYHNVTQAKGLWLRPLRLRTKLEQSAPESLTQLPSRFVLIHM